MIAAALRQGMMGASGYTAKDYVQDGLVAMWDGIENAGWGVHDQNATVWKDLVGGVNIPLAESGWQWSNDSLVSDGTTLPIVDDGLPGFQFKTAEIVFSFDGYTASNTTSQVIVFASNQTGSSNSYNKYLFVTSYRNANTRLLVGAATNSQKLVDFGKDIFGDTKSIRIVYSTASGSGPTVDSVYLVGESKEILSNQYGEALGYLSGYKFSIFGRTGQSARIMKGRIMSIRLYSNDGFAANYTIDKARFSLTA